MQLFAEERICRTSSNRTLIVVGVMYPQFYRTRILWRSVPIGNLDVGRIPAHNSAAVCEGCQFGAGRTRQSARERLCG
jgi:hypothetical protein